MTMRRGWDESYAALMKYKDDYGDCLVPASYQADTALGHWVSQSTLRGEPCAVCVYARMEIKLPSIQSNGCAATQPHCVPLLQIGIVRDNELLKTGTTNNCTIRILCC